MHGFLVARELLILRLAATRHSRGVLDASGRGTWLSDIHLLNLLTQLVPTILVILDILHSRIIEAGIEQHFELLHGDIKQKYLIARFKNAIDLVVLDSSDYKLLSDIHFICPANVINLILKL